MYRSLDRAETWAQSSTGVSPKQVWRLAVSASNRRVMYAIGYVLPARSLLFLKTSDGGATWRSIVSSFPSSERPVAVTADPRDANTVFVAVSTGELFKSVTGGE